MKILKGEITDHPRGDISAQKKKAIVIGATGATGTKLVRLLLDSDNWDKHLWLEEVVLFTLMTVLPSGLTKTPNGFSKASLTLTLPSIFVNPLVPGLTAVIKFRVISA